MPKYHQAALAAAFTAFLAVNVLTLKNGHNWGDDFAQYILHAVNLVRHQPYTADIALDLWTVVPPGFPLLLSPVIYWAGISFPALKFLNILGWGLTALAGYFLAVKRLRPAPATALTAWFLSAPVFFFFKQNVLSDIPFLCFVTLALLSFETWRSCEEKRRPFFYGLAVFLMGYAMLIRWVGIILFLAAILYLVINREWKKTPGFILGAGITAAAMTGFGSSPAGHFGAAQFPPGTWLHAVWMNTAVLSKTLLEFIITGPLGKGIEPGVWTVSKFLGPAVFLALTAFFFYKLSRKTIGFLGCFTFLYLLGLVLWPVQQGLPRYILPAVIPLAVYSLDGLRRLFPKPAADKWLVALFIVLIAQNAAVTAKHWTFNDDDIFQKETLEMADWVTDHLAPEEHYMFYKPRALRLLTDRTGTPFWVYPEDRDSWYLRADKLHIGYVVAAKGLDGLAEYDGLNLPGGESGLKLRAVWENPGYKIFKVIR